MNAKYSLSVLRLKSLISTKQPYIQVQAFDIKHVLQYIEELEAQQRALYERSECANDTQQSPLIQN